MVPSRRRTGSDRATQIETWCPLEGEEDSEEERCGVGRLEVGDAPGMLGGCIPRWLGTTSITTICLRK